MRWSGHELPRALVLVIVAWLSCLPTGVEAQEGVRRRRRELRERTRAAFLHAYEGYKKHAFPADELLPVSCQGKGHDTSDGADTSLNDVLGDYALTLVDTLDTHAVMGDRPGFERAVREAIEHVSFDNDVHVQVFEVTIRQLGGLLSAHLLATSPKRGFMLGDWYHGELLDMAYDLGVRLLPAFDTPTGIPYARVNLQHGLRANETTETCTAGAGSLILEFMTLSRLTGDEAFETAAKRAFFAIWNRRSDLDLVGNTINAVTGDWMHSVSSTGAGIDSFFEYAAKAYVLSGEEDYLRVWDESYAAIRKHIRSPDGFWYRGVHAGNGQAASIYVDSLSAFFPGVQVLMGDLESAIRSHLVYAWQWRRYHALPELFDTNRRQAVSKGYPLRPEFIESNMYLYSATKDEFYLDMAEQILYDLTNRTTTACGMSALLDVTTGELEDKMPSFLTSETLKYLYMTFAEPDDPWVRDDSNMVFSTEGHMLELDSDFLKKRPRRRKPKNEHVCPVYDAVRANASMHALLPSVATRPEMDLARFLVSYALPDEKKEISAGRWTEYGRCDAPAFDKAYDDVEVLFSMTPQQEDAKPSKRKVLQFPGGNVLVKNIHGLRFWLARDWDVSDGFYVRRIGQFRIPPGGVVVISDPVVVNSVQPRRPSHVELSFATTSPQHNYKLQANDTSEHFVTMSALASFGPHLVTVDTPDGHLAVSMPPFGQGCENDDDSSRRADSEVDARQLNEHEHSALVVKRGGCTFYRKAAHAKAQGYSAVLVVNGQEEGSITPSADEPVPGGRDESPSETVPLFLIDHETGERLERAAVQGYRARVRVQGSQHGAVILGGYLVLNVRIKG